MQDLKGKLVLVTGAASGIGRASALEFGREGAVLALVDVDEAGLVRVAGEIERAGGRASRYLADLRDPEQVGLLKERLVLELGVPDVLMNVAGVAIVCCVEKATLEDWHWVLDLNLFGYINVINAFLEDMFARGSGRVVNVASGAGLFAVPYQAPYNTSKHAVMGLTDSIRQEGRRYGVGATAVCPGMIDTPIIGTARLLGFGASTIRPSSKKIAASPEKLAVRIVRAVKKDRSIVIYPSYIKALYLLKRISLGLADIIGAQVARAFYAQHKCD